MSIDWNDPDAHVTPHFTVREALLLPRWDALHSPTYTEKANIQVMAGRMEDVRALLDMPVHVHCWIRPAHANLKHPANDERHRQHDGEDYNALVRGRDGSMHIVGGAVDFHVGDYTTSARCRTVRSIILPHLERLGLRMEDYDGPWLHLDMKRVRAGGKRYFHVN